MTEHSSSRIMGAALIGGIAGAGLALLFAPRAGKETRQHIHNNLEEAKDSARDLKNRLSSVAHQTSETAKAEMEELRKNRKSKLHSPTLSSWEEEV